MFVCLFVCFKIGWKSHYVRSRYRLTFYLCVCLFHFFSETANHIGLKSYMSLPNHKAQRCKHSGGVCHMHNYAYISVIIHKKCIFPILHLLLAPYSPVREFTGTLLGKTLSGKSDGFFEK